MRSTIIFPPESKYFANNKNNSKAVSLVEGYRTVCKNGQTMFITRMRPSLPGGGINDLEDCIAIDMLVWLKVSALIMGAVGSGLGDFFDGSRTTEFRNPFAAPSSLSASNWWINFSVSISNWKAGSCFLASSEKSWSFELLNGSPSISSGIRVDIFFCSRMRSVTVSYRISYIVTSIRN